MFADGIPEWVKNSPPVSYFFSSAIIGLSVNTVVSILTGIYTILLIIGKARSLYKNWKAKHSHEEGED